MNTRTRVLAIALIATLVALAVAVTLLVTRSEPTASAASTEPTAAVTLTADQAFLGAATDHGLIPQHGEFAEMRSLAKSICGTISINHFSGVLRALTSQGDWNRVDAEVMVRDSVEAYCPTQSNYLP